ALVAPRTVVAAMRTSADYETVGEEAAVGVGIDLLGRANFEVAVLPQGAREMLRQLVIGLVGRTAEMIPAELEPLAGLLLKRKLPVAEFAHTHAGLGCCELRRRAMFVRRADRQRLEALCAPEPR